MTLNVTKYPVKHEVNDFILHLESIDVESNLIERFNGLPKSVSHQEVQYNLNIITSGDDNYELNYYSPEYLNFLLPYNVYNNIESALTFLEENLSKYVS